MRITIKKVKGINYFYAEKSIRLTKPKTYYVFLGKSKPDNKDFKKIEDKLLDKVYFDLLGNSERIYLSKENLIEVEKKRRIYENKLSKLSRSQRNNQEEVETVDFVYTTLSTEGIPVTRIEAASAYEFSQKNTKSLRDENLNVSLDMINGLRKIHESKQGLSIKFIKELHEIIMENYKDKHPGQFRVKPATIKYNGIPIDFNTSPAAQISKQLEELVNWYNINVNKLNAIELASLLHLKFYKIHPFEDGNKRTSRLLVNKALQDKQYPILNISKNRQEYFNALVASVEQNKDKKFVEFTLNEFIRQTKL